MPGHYPVDVNLTLKIIEKMKIIGKILWADDEIELLKPHILYLEKKGYLVDPVNSGEDALVKIDMESYDVVLLDEMMTGMDGLTTLKEIKIRQPGLPVVMVTKNEEEWLMDEAIGAQIANFLTKPVNPSQVLMACKNILEKSKLLSDHTAKSYLDEFQKISSEVDMTSSHSDWYSIFNNLTSWQIKFDKFGDAGLSQIFQDQYQEANNKFSSFIKDNYQSWIHSKDKPTLSHDIFDRFIQPELCRDDKVIFIVIDCLRFDQLKILLEFVYNFYNIRIEPVYSILPTATPFSRNAIFSGLYPLEIQEKYPEYWMGHLSDESSLNQFEERLLRLQMDRNGLSKKNMSYNKILIYEEGKKLLNRIGEYKNIDLISIVVNFVDMLGHSRSESDVLKEMVPDEMAYRNVIGSWFENSWLLSLLNKVSDWGHKVIIASDHGTIRVRKPLKVKADKHASKGVRYKVGRNLITNKKSSLIIKNPRDYYLPVTDVTTNYIIACNQNFYVYPNDYHYYINKFQDTFQHGGISMDEMIIPTVILTGK